MTDQAGHFEIDHVPIGDVVVGRSICLNQKTITIGTTHFVQLRTEPGQTAHADIGGTGQPVVGRLVAPAGFNQTLDWTMSQAEVHTKASEGFQPPANWATMTDAQRKDLVAQWRAAHPSPNGGHQFREFYPFPIQEDGFFRVEDVPPGEYALTVTVHEPPVAGSFNLGKPMATVRREFTVPELSGGRSDLPLDLGELLIEPTPQQR
jgi:hypothetical protein